ncbi:hypothetical protein F4703DRAFT_1822535 [Phycomyces blakesleeanus]
MTGPAVRKSKQRNARQNSNAFGIFTGQEIMEYKQVFGIMDTNDDGIVDAKDLEVTFQRLGQPASVEQLENMMSEAPGSINFTVFLTLMADKRADIDQDNVIMDAFSAFDESGKGIINAEYLRECMTTMGDRFTDEEVDIMFKGTPVDGHGNFNYRDFVNVLKHCG